MKLPQIRNENFVVQNLNKELLVYDLSNNRVYSLNETSAIVYNACGIGLTFSDLRSDHAFTDDIIILTLDVLGKNNLLDNSFISPLKGVSRREIIHRAGLATMVALPMISALAAPTAAQAQSGVVGLGGDCTSAICASGLTCTTQFGTTLCRAFPGDVCTFSRPDLCTSGCCIASQNGPICCS